MIFIDSNVPTYLVGASHPNKLAAQRLLENLIRPEERLVTDAGFDTDCANIFVMCERGPILDRLRNAEKTGSIVVNSPEAIRNTYRHRMVELFAQHGVSVPPSQIVASDTSKARPPKGVWVKRYDFHATEAHDVMYAASEDGWREALHGFAKRGIPYVVAQEHVPGDLVKFYGVRNTLAPLDANWLEWFYHRDKGMLGYSFEVSNLRAAAFRAAADANRFSEQIKAGLSPWQVKKLYIDNVRAVVPEPDAEVLLARRAEREHSRAQGARGRRLRHDEPGHRGD